MNIVYTIIIPHYNTPRLLQRLLKTIPDSQEIQVIVVDDRSCEHITLYEECKKQFANRNIEFYTNDRKKSAGTCRNIALEKAKGKWLIFADADDYFLENFYWIINQKKDDEFDIIYFSPAGEDLVKTTKSFRHLDYEALITNFLNDKRCEVNLKVFFNPPWSKMIKRDLVSKNQITFDEELVANDVMFSVKCALAANKIIAHKERIYCITQQEKSLTTDMSEEKFDVRLRVFIRMFHFVKENTSLDEFKKLNLCAIDQLFKIMKNNYGIRKMFEVISILKKNNIPIITFKGITYKRLKLSIINFVVRKKNKKKK